MRDANRLVGDGDKQAIITSVTEIAVVNGQITRYSESVTISSIIESMVRPRPSAAWCGWLVTWAASILPAADRTRGLEEYRSELYELAVIGAPQRARLACALRILLRAPLLRWELRRPQREPAS